MGSEVRIEAMVARASHRLQVAAVAVVIVAALGIVDPGNALAVEPPSPGPLDRPFSDLALVDAGADDETGAPPLLLVADVTDQPPGRVRLALLDRAVEWGTVAETAVRAPTDDDVAAPWLVELEPDRFALIQVSNERALSFVTLVRVQTGSSPAVAVERPRPIDLAVDDAGAIDTDGDGTNELVLANARTERQGATCQGSTIKTLDGRTLVERSEWRVPNIRLAGGVLGAWDETIGGDLLAYAYGNCPAGPDSGLRLGLYGLRLSDGAEIVSLSAGATPVGLVPGVPLAADLDGDGRQEIVVHDGALLSILDPARDWTPTPVGSGDVLPILAAPATATTGGTLVWLEHSGPDDQLRYSVAKVTREAEVLSFEVESMDMTELTPARRARVLASIRDQALAQAPPQAWLGTIEDGCERVIAPLLTTGCDGRPDEPLRVGASWLATRPVTAYDDTRERHKLLVAATVEWRPELGVPRPATPAAVFQPGAWRHGPSPRFVLSEVRATDVAYFSNFPVPRPTIGRRPVRTAATDLPGFTGSRVFARLIAMAEDDPASAETRNLDTFFRQPASDGEQVSVGRIPVPAGAESGRDGSFIRVALDEVRTPDGLSPSRWTLSIVQINDWGEVAGPLSSTIVLDAAGPTLTVETPFMSPIWPFESTIHGRSEPGVEILGGSGEMVTADRRGRFEVTTHLLPWPQTVELVAVDDLGNKTTGRYSLVGGVDYRLLPWPAILAAILLGVAFWSTGRGQRPAKEVEIFVDTDPRPEIEELTPTPHSPQAPRLRTWRL